MWNVQLITSEQDDPIGPDESAHGGSGKHEFYAVRFLGKTDNDPRHLYTVPNELAAGFIGQCLGLDVATAMPHRTDGGKEMALIRWRQFHPRISDDVERFVRENPDVIHGAIIFDLFVANNDRGVWPLQNLAFGRDGTAG